MYRLISSYQLRALQSKFPGIQVRFSWKSMMDSKQEDIVQPIGRQSPKEEVREFTTTTNVEELGKFSHSVNVLSRFSSAIERQNLKVMLKTNLHSLRVSVKSCFRVRQRINQQVYLVFQDLLLRFENIKILFVCFKKLLTKIFKKPMHESESPLGACWVLFATRTLKRSMV